MTPIEKQAVRLFIKWANSVAKAVGDTYRFKQKDFGKPYGYVETKAILNVGWYDLHVIEASTGDEGGPSILYVWVSKAHGAMPQGVVMNVVQEFDTMVGQIYSDGKLINTEGFKE